MLKQRYFTANSVISAVTWLISTMMILIAVLVMFFLKTLDDKEIEDLHERVVIALNKEKDELVKLNMEYSFWDLSYQNTVERRDQKWVDDMYRDYLVPTYNLSFIALIYRDKTVELLGKHEESKPFHQQLNSLMSSSIMEKFDMIHNQDLSALHQSFFTKFQGAIYLVSAEPFLYDESETVVDGSLLVLARELTPEFLAELSKQFKLPSLSFDSNLKHDDSLLLTGPKQHTAVGELFWQSDKLSSQIIPYLYTILAAFFIFTIVLTRWILKKDLSDLSDYQDKLFHAATTDALTGVANRRYFMEFGSKEMKINLLQKKSMAVLILDIDHFKSVNDRYGHAIGDQALKHFADICRRNIRDSDIFGRVGGEEFAILLNEYAEEQALKLAERMRVLVSHSPLIIGDRRIELTVSIGLATLAQHCTFDELLDNADKALYEAKNSGRNTVILSR